MDKTIGNIMKKTHIVIKEDNLEEYILKNFKEDAFVEISYNRVFIPGKILYIDDDASITLQLKGRTKIDDEQNYISRQISGQHQTLSPMGTIFEISALVFLDSVIAQMMHDLGQTEEDLKSRHTVLE